MKWQFHSRPRSRIRGFTVLEFLFVLVSLAVLIGLMIPKLGGHSRKSTRINCVSNLKQIGLGLRMWSNDHDERFPWQVQASAPLLNIDGGGANLSPGASNILQTINDGNVTVFRTISNELNSPKVLVCPNDKKRQRAVTFESGDRRSFQSSNQVSYFVGLTADERRPQEILTGDRNITGGQYINRRRFWYLREGQVIKTGFDASMHHKAGNIGLADGSAQQLDNSQLPKRISQSLQANGRRMVLQFP